MHMSHASPKRVHRFDAPSFMPPTSREEEHARIQQAYAAAESRGYADGHGQGMRSAQAEIDAVMARHQEAEERANVAAAVFAEAARQLRDADSLVIGDLQRTIVELAVELASEIVGRDVLLDGAALESVRAAAALAPEREPIVVRVNPRDAEAVRDELFLLDLPTGSSVVMDPTVGRGQCVLDAGACRIDHQISGALARMRTAVAEFYGGAQHTVRLPDGHEPTRGGHEVAA